MIRYKGPVFPATGRGRRAITAAAKGIGLGVVFLLAAAGGAVLHLGLPAPRRFVTARVNSLLDGTFNGKVVIRRLDRIRLTRLEGIDAEVFDPEGRRVLLVHDAQARIGTGTLLRSLVSGDSLLIRIPELRVGWAEVVLEENAAGELGLQRAFVSRAPATGKPSRGTDVSISDIHIGHVWAHGHMAAVPVLDADLDGFAGAFASTPKTTDIDVAHLFVRGRGLPGKDPEGTVVARVSLPSGSPDERQVSVRYEGHIGAIAVLADGSLTGKKVVARVDVPETAPDALAALAPGRLRLGAAMSAHVEVHGELPVLRPALRARIGQGGITASGTVTLPDDGQPDLGLSVRVEAKDIDVSVLHEGAPASSLSATIDAFLVSRPAGRLEGNFHIESQVGEVSGQVVPAASLRGEITERSVLAWGQIAERGAPTAIAVSLQPRGDAPSPSQLDFEVDVTVPDLDAIERLGPIGRGRAHLVVKGNMDLDTEWASATAIGELAGIRVKGVQLARGFVTAAARGTIESLRFDATVRGGGLRAGGYLFTDVRASASGSPQELDVSARLLGDSQSPHVSARAHLTSRGDLTVRGADLRIERGDTATTAKIASVRVVGGAVEIRGVEALGLGAPVHASARISAAGVTVKAKGADVDLARVARLLGRREDTRGHLAFDVDAATRGRDASGRVDATISDLSTMGVDGATVRVSTSIQGTHVKAEILAGLAETGRLQISAPDIALGGPVMELGSWKSATGAVAMDGLVDIERVLSLFPEDMRPVEAASGTITLRGKASRSSSSAGPALEIDATTDHLTLVAVRAKTRNADGSVTLGPAPWQTTGLDGGVVVALNGETGDTEVSARLHDKHGPLLSASASARLPLLEIVDSPGRLLALVSHTPLQASVDVPRRRLDDMPSAFGSLPVKGDVELGATLEGTTLAPKLTLKAKGTSLIPRNAANCTEPIDIDASVTYDGQEAGVRVAASRGGREILGAGAIVKVSAPQALAGGEIAWEASGDVALSRLPLDVVGALLHRPLGGDVSGKITLDDLHRAASLEADLDLRDMSFDRTAIPNGKVRVHMKDGSLSATARLNQSDGYLETTAKGTMVWGAALAPDIHLARAVEIGVRAENFRINAAAPFLQGTLSDLDGRIDADARIHVESGAKESHVDGAVTLRDGAVEVPQLGEKLHALRGRVTMKPWGTLRFEDFSAEAPTGKLTASADAVLDGLTLQNANLELHVARGQDIPITIEGVPMGQAYGDVTARAVMSQDGKRLDINVAIPVLHVDLPQSTGHSVQPLEPDSTVRIGRRVGDDFALIALGPPEKPRAPSDLEIHASVTLGDDVEVKRDTTIQMVARGKVDILLTDKARVTGQIGLQRGKLEIQGKQFVIDHGAVSFVGGDPADPIIIATAYWDAPGATRVYADFSGHVSSGKLGLRSEPSLSQDQILALLLFGSPDGSFGAEPAQGQGDAATAASTKAASMAGGLVTQGLNKAISGITTADITTRVDTSKSDSPRPELAVQLTKEVSARLGYKLGVPAPGDNPDRTELTLEWRFIRNWSLVGVVGDRGSTALDVVWRLRY